MTGRGDAWLDLSAAVERTIMADKVFINGRAAIHKGSAGKSIAFPDVCLCPPSPPTGPIPTPLVNTAQAVDLKGGALTVTIEGNPVAHNESYIARTTGNEIARSTGGGVITHQVQGRAHFQTFSMNVFIESKPAVRHMDLVTHNHLGKLPGNTPPTPWMSAMTAGGPGPVPEKSETQATEGRDYITLALRDQSKRPVVGLRVLIQSPGKRSFRRPTPSGGEITLRGLKQGTCQVTLLDREGRPMKQVKPKLFAPAPDGAAVSLPTGKKHELTCEIATMTIELAHPRPGRQVFPKLVLESTDGSYRQQRTARNNLLRDSRRLRLRFDYLPKGARFTLTQHDGPKLERILFREKPFDDIVDRAPDDGGGAP